MRHRGAVRGWKTLSRVALVGMIGGGAAACSTDASRLSEPFSNPFSSITGEPAATGSLAKGEEATQTTVPAIRTSRIQSQELVAPGPAMSPRPAAGAAMAAPVEGTVSGVNPSGLNPDTGRGAKGQAMTPRVTQAAPQAKPAEKKVEKAAEKAADTKKPVQKTAEAKPQSKADPKKAEAAKKAEAEAHAARGEAVKEAAKKVAEAKAAEAAAKASTKESKVAAKATPAPAPTQSKPAVPEPANTGSVASVSNDSFRWPAKGRVINGYGTAGNEGINIAVPEGTPVKAAEDGTVAYAGSDVKGYGKLVLVRHSNGYVSAYAHNGELDVRPGDKVKRGQTIAKSGATGNVTSPQLHFEIRKGASPVDPIPHLASN